MLLIEVSYLMSCAIHSSQVDPDSVSMLLDDLTSYLSTHYVGDAPADTSSGAKAKKPASKSKAEARKPVPAIPENAYSIFVVNPTANWSVDPAAGHIVGVHYRHTRCVCDASLP